MQTLRGLPRWCLGCLFLVTGCHSIPLAEMMQRARHNDIQTASFSEPQTFAPASAGDARGTMTNLGQDVKGPKAIPISLDTVFRLAQDHNGQVRLARLRVEDAMSDQHWASKHWLPDLSIGIGAWRHDGGIQDFQGNLLRSSYTSALGGLEFTGKYDWKEVLVKRVEAERSVWQQKAELSKLTSENLLDAASTYVGILAARSGVAISAETEGRLKELLDQTKKLADVDPGLRVEVSRIEAELMAQTVLTVKLREANKGASGKLAYLLGLNPCCEFIVADGKLVPIVLVDTKEPLDNLVDRALTQGPGVRELEGLLRTVTAARKSNYGLSHWMPVVEVGLLEGGFGAGPATRFDWANRFDFGVKAKWNLSEFYYARQKRHQADMNIQQVHVSYHDLRSKLTLGVQEARDSIASGFEQVDLAERHIRHAEESYRLSDLRFKQNIKGRSASEVLLALRTLGGARLEYLQAVRDLNRAQLRLFVLVGTTEK